MIILRPALVVALLAVAGCGAAEPDVRDQARAAVLEQLRDPESARFGEMHVNPAGVVCGTVNARNAFGGYAGLTAFYYDPRDGMSEIVLAGGRLSRKMVEAASFEARGCSIGPEHELALREERNFRARQAATPTP